MGTISRIGFGGVLFTLSIFFQETLSYSVEESGLFFCVIAASMAISRLLVKKMLEIWGFQKVLFFSVVALSLSINLIGQLSEATEDVIIISYLAFYGFSLSIYLGALHLYNLFDVQRDKVTHAVLWWGIIQQLSMGIGIIVCALLITYFENTLGFNADLHLSSNIFSLIFSILAFITLLSSFPSLFAKGIRLKRKENRIGATSI